MRYRDNSTESEILQLIKSLIFYLCVIYILYQAINTNIEKIYDTLANEWSWYLVVLFCLFISGLLSFYFRKKIKNVNGI